MHGHVFQHLGVDGQPGAGGGLLQDLQPRLTVGGVDLHHHAGEESADELLGQPPQHARVGVRGHHHLATGRLDGVEGVQELLLGGLLGGQEVDVVDH